ncbi:nuclear transport factor 2 family protein [Georgenia sp. AZ-5]|uniref:nuclear transport factor 2 family protein n=1 Tax=Georgenia sp. AZ-5 TaxID=3367526 RepID=UPI0037547D6B
MLTLERLMASEMELAAGDGATYRRVLTENALVVVPGMVLDAEACIKTMDASPPWDSTQFWDAHLVRLTPDSAAVVYTFEGVRGGNTYRAVLSSTYVLRDGVPRLALHQQTQVT